METATETTHSANESAPKGKSRSRLVILIAAAVVVIALVVASFFLPVKQYLVDVLTWCRSLGVWGPFIVIIVYIVACVFFLPGLVLTLGAGFIFGLLKGTVVVSIASTLGASAAFLVGRTIARDWVEKKVAANPKFAAIDRAVEREGFKIVFLTRLSPVFPFNLLNYVFGLTKVGFWKYVLASWIGMLPGTIMYVYLGTVMESLVAAAADQAERSTAETVFLWVGLVMAIIVVAFVTRVARKALRDVAPEATQTGVQSAPS
jgi:uncharacterized membrane protein YdjX (TVP38/TMEM64 family)